MNRHRRQHEGEAEECNAVRNFGAIDSHRRHSCRVPQYNNNKLKTLFLMSSYKLTTILRCSITRRLIAWSLVLNLVCNAVLSEIKSVEAVPSSGLADEELNSLQGGHFVSEWAAHIPGGDDVAEQVAQQHGFVILGKILEDYYHLYHHKVSKRSLVPADVHQSRLDSDERVRWSEQQRAKIRRKRDYVKPGRQSKIFRLNDPKWPMMWYLNRGNGLDMNVVPAWKEGITGKGVVVTILDDGLETDHPDLVANYDPKASYDVNSHDDDPSPHYDMTDSNRHGTRCAGEVAATANNSECAVGIAFGARVGGVRMLDGDVTDAVEARSLSLNPQHIDIYSASWGPDDDGKTVDGPGEMATRAFMEGVSKGRGGKGSIFIWASGNGGREHDNCNCDGYTNSIWTLSISSATEEGLVPWYSEMCSSTLATTYSSGNQNEKQVVTTDLHHSCTASHTGTSASAPLAAGIAALVLEANRNLTWRDLQHIVVRSAKPGNLKDQTWSKNGVGRRVSHSFGYGLMDAHAMVKLARTWKQVPEQQRCEINSPHFDKQILPKTRLKLQLTVKDCKGVNFIEHVQAKITLTSQRRGDIQIYLTSPAGTRVTLLTSRSHDISRAGFSNWPFMSVHTWGEAPHGNWQLEILNEGRYMAQITQWDLIFHGTEEAPQPNDPPRYGIDKPNLESESYDGEVGQNVLEFEPGTAGQWRDVQQVGETHSDRQRTATNDLTGTACRNFSADSSCIVCLQTTFLFQGKCYSSCPERSFMVPEKSASSASSVTSSSLRRRRHINETLDMVSPGEVVLPLHDPPQKLCAPCHFSCLQCRGPNEYDCSSCAPDSILTRVGDSETYCYPPTLGSESDDTIFLARLNSNELLMVGMSLGAIVFVIILGGYFFFRNVCCQGTKKTKDYTYNALLTGEEEQRLRLTYSEHSAVAFRREIDAIVNDTSSDEEEEEDDILNRVVNRR